MPRHFIVVFLSFYAEFSLAAANEWNCEKNEAGEWSCVTELPPVEKSQPPAAQKQKVSKTGSKPATKEVPEAKVVKSKPEPLPEEPRDIVESLPVVVSEKEVSVAEKEVSVAEKEVSVPEKEVSVLEKEISVAEKEVSVPEKEVSVPEVSTPAATIPTPAVKTKKTLKPHEPVAIPNIQTAQNPVPVSLIPPTSVDSANQEGWTCAPNQENSTWDCHLVGTNPKGEAKIVAEDETRFRLIAPAFDLKQERTFKNLRKEFPFDPWQQCSAPGRPKQKLIPRKGLRETSPLEIEADYSEVFDKKISSFIGNVDMTRADQHLQADMASYDSGADMMDTQGNVYYSEDGLALFSNTAVLKLANDKAVLRDVLFESLTGPYRGSAEVAYKDSKSLSRYKEAAYTSCAPGNQDWVIHAAKLKTNKDIGEGSATNAWLEFKGVPVLYTPYINFPIDDRRKSGFFAPSLGRTSKSGFQLTTPYYWNIAPNYDVLFRPRYLQTRGPLFAADMRYLTEMTQGSVGIEFMPYDTSRKTSRFLGAIRNTSTFLPNLTANADLNYVSDKDYLYELGTALSIADSRYVQSRANLNYNIEGLSFAAQFQGYQTIDNTIPVAYRPYQKIPQLNLDLNHSFEFMPVDLALNNEFVYFYRNNIVSGQRLDIKPSITMPLRSASGFLTPKLSLEHTQYFLENQEPNSAKIIGRTLPIASLDSGLFLEQEFQSGDNSFLHTLEPRAFYLYVPYAKQDNNPIFDTSLNDFSFASIFRENRFSGHDRVQDANQLSLGLTSRLLDAKTGQEYLKLGIGEVIYFKDRKVNLPGYTDDMNYLIGGYTAATNRFSNLVTEVSGTINEHFSYFAGTQWDPYRNRFPRANVGLQFVNQPEQIINLNYSYREGQIGQTDVSFRWPLLDDWYLMGRWLYALNFNATKESFIGLEKDSCCWRFSIIGRRFSNALSNTVESKLQTGIFVQLELKGLGSFGDKVDQFLERNIMGYSRPQTK